MLQNYYFYLKEANYLSKSIVEAEKKESLYVGTNVFVPANDQGTIKRSLRCGAEKGKQKVGVCSMLSV